MQRLVCIMHSYRLAAIIVKMGLVCGYIVVDLLILINIQLILITLRYNRVCINTCSGKYNNI